MHMPQFVGYEPHVGISINDEYPMAKGEPHHARANQTSTLRHVAQHRIIRKRQLRNVADPNKTRLCDAHVGSKSQALLGQGEPGLQDEFRLALRPSNSLWHKDREESLEVHLAV